MNILMGCIKFFLQGIEVSRGLRLILNDFNFHFSIGLPLRTSRPKCRAAPNGRRHTEALCHSSFHLHIFSFPVVPPAFFLFYYNMSICDYKYQYFSCFISLCRFSLNMLISSSIMVYNENIQTDIGGTDIERRTIFYFSQRKFY